jgi:hypothetical protein
MLAVFTASPAAPASELRHDMRRRPHMNAIGISLVPDGAAVRAAPGTRNFIAITARTDIQKFLCFHQRV